MNNSSEQDGRQPPLPPQPPPSLDTCTETANSEQRPICRNFLWGRCTKYNQCKFRHELDTNEMKKILIFCHDYQNRTGCLRENCTYLHTTREEENLFHATGEIPRVLVERHAAIAAAAANASTAETISQIEMFINESYSTPGQPPPPPAAAPVAVAGVVPVATRPSMPGPVTAPRPPPPAAAPVAMAGAVPVAARPSISGPVTAPPPPPPLRPPPVIPPAVQQPPPPPPPPPPTCTNSIIRATNPVYNSTSIQTTPVAFAPSQPLPTLPVFDVTRPPPPLPIHMQQQNGTIKRRPTGTCEAGPSKSRRVEVNNLCDDYCDSCLQRQLRIQLYEQQCDNLRREEKYQIIVHKKKLEEYELSKQLLKSIVSADLYRILDEYIEGAPEDVQTDDILAQFNQVPDTSTVPRDFLMQLMNVVTRNSRSVDTGPSSTTRNSDLFRTIFEMLVSSNASQSESRARGLIDTEVNRVSAASTSINSGTNGLSVYPNGQSVANATVVPIAGPSRIYAGTSNTTARLYTGPGVSGPSGIYTEGTPVLPVPASAPAPSSVLAPTPPSGTAYPLYHPSIPPPPSTRHYYMQSSPLTSNMENAAVPFNPAVAATTSQSARSSTSSVSLQYGLDRHMPPPHYYPPYK